MTRIPFFALGLPPLCIKPELTQGKDGFYWVTFAQSSPIAGIDRQEEELSDVVEAPSKADRDVGPSKKPAPPSRTTRAGPQPAASSAAVPDMEDVGQPEDDSDSSLDLNTKPRGRGNTRGRRPPGRTRRTVEVSLESLSSDTDIETSTAAPPPAKKGKRAPKKKAGASSSSRKPAPRARDSKAEKKRQAEIKRTLEEERKRRLDELLNARRAKARVGPGGRADARRANDESLQVC